LTPDRHRPTLAAAMRPSELVSLAALAALLALAIAGTPRALAPAAAFAALAACTVLVGRLARRGSLLRDYFPAVAVILVFLFLEPVIEGVNPRRWDAFFAAVDGRWLAGLVASWRGAFGRPSAFTDAVYLAYVSYYLLPLAVLTLARARGTEVCERVTFAVLLTFWLSFAGYFLLPTSGPRIPPAEEALRLGGGAVAMAVRAFLHVAETTRLDAFPSGHTAVSIVSAWAGARAAPRLRAPLLAWAGMVVFSTVYVHVHYAVDVVAGAALAAAAAAVSRPLSRGVAAVAAAVTRRLEGTPPRAEGA
jgi:membrane-associated phospholipid phosphatase